MPTQLPLDLDDRRMYLQALRKGHNNHCLVRFMGKVWTISKIKNNVWTLTDEHGLTTKMDVSDVRWDEYTEARVSLLWQQ